MTPSIASLDNVLRRQAILFGRLTNALSGDAIKQTPAIKLAWRITGSSDYVDTPHVPSVKSGGYYTFHGAPKLFFPSLEVGQSLDCRLTFSVSGYQDNSVEFTLSRAVVTPETVTETHAGVEVEIARLDAPVREQDIALLPEPVSLAGRVIVDNDLDSPVEGATASIISPPAGGNAVSNAAGYFRIDGLPVANRVTVRIQRNGVTLEQEVLLDFGRRINERIFSFST